MLVVATHELEAHILQRDVKGRSPTDDIVHNNTRDQNGNAAGLGKFLSGAVHIMNEHDGDSRAVDWTEGYDIVGVFVTLCPSESKFEFRAPVHFKLVEAAWCIHKPKELTSDVEV